MVDNISSIRRSEIMSHIHGRNTSPELAVRRVLHKMGYRYSLHKKTLPGSPDIVMARHRLAIFIDGCFWHGHKCRRNHKARSHTYYWENKVEKNRIRDKENDKLLRKLGWNVLRIWECRTENTSVLKRHLYVKLVNG
jgi:DNA mismatch endonuclease (patch repair protein)